MNRRMTNPIAWTQRLGLAALLFTQLIGCSRAQDAAKPANAMPIIDAATLQEGVNPRYVTPAGVKQECVGRQVFDAPWEMEWGVYRYAWEDRRSGFSEVLQSGSEVLYVGDDLRIHVSKDDRRATPGDDRERSAQQFLDDWIASRKLRNAAGIRNYTQLSESPRRLIKRLTELKRKTRDQKKLQSIDREINGYKKEIADNERTIVEIKEDNPELDMGMPDARGWGGEAIVLRNGYAYQFESSGSSSEEDADESTGKKTKQETATLVAQSRATFVKAVQNFRYRKLYEIPKGRGICVPYGFWPDDGTATYHTNATLRWADRPNVLYHFDTGTVTRLGSELTGMKAGAVAGMGLGSIFQAEATKRVKQRIGPRPALIGGLRGEQGGAVLNVADDDKPPVLNYMMYTGYGGYGGSQVLPFVIVEMKSYTKEQEPALKDNPPPFDESVQRLERFLKSVRLRPTDVPMPELSDNPPPNVKR